MPEVREWHWSTADLTVRAWAWTKVPARPAGAGGGIPSGADRQEVPTVLRKEGLVNDARHPCRLTTPPSGVAEWLPWGLLAVAVIAGVAFGINRQLKVNDLEDQLAATENVATQRIDTLSQKAQAARKAAVGLDRNVKRQQADIATLDTQLERSRQSVAALRQSVASGESTTASLRAALTRAQAQLAAASATTKRLASCQSAARGAVAAGQEVATAVGHLEEAIAADQGSPSGDLAVSRAAAALERAEQEWLVAEPALESCG